MKELSSKIFNASTKKESEVESPKKEQEKKEKPSLSWFNKVGLAGIAVFAGYQLFRLIKK